MDPSSRFAALATREIAGVRVPVASGLESRLLGLAFLPRERAGPGLLIPRCRSVHTLGMRFPLDLVFYDASGAEVRRVDSVPRGGSWRSGERWRCWSWSRRTRGGLVAHDGHESASGRG